MTVNTMEYLFVKSRYLWTINQIFYTCKNISMLIRFSRINHSTNYLWFLIFHFNFYVWTDWFVWILITYMKLVKTSNLWNIRANLFLRIYFSFCLAIIIYLVFLLRWRIQKSIKLYFLTITWIVQESLLLLFFNYNYCVTNWFRVLIQNHLIYK